MERGRAALTGVRGGCAGGRWTGGRIPRAGPPAWGAGLGQPGGCGPAGAGRTGSRVLEAPSGLDLRWRRGGGGAGPQPGCGAAGGRGSVPGWRDSRRRAGQPRTRAGRAAGCAWRRTSRRRASRLFGWVFRPAARGAAGSCAAGLRIRAPGRSVSGGLSPPWRRRPGFVGLRRPGALRGPAERDGWLEVGVGGWLGPGGVRLASRVPLGGSAGQALHACLPRPRRRWLPEVVAGRPRSRCWRGVARGRASSFYHGRWRKMCECPGFCGPCGGACTPRRCQGTSPERRGLVRGRGRVGSELPARARAAAHRRPVGLPPRLVFRTPDPRSRCVLGPGPLRDGPSRRRGGCSPRLGAAA
jgi:hypothetical protein